MITLAVDTSSKACSCAVFERGMLLSERFLNVGLTHSRTLAALIEGALADAGLTPGRVAGLAVSVGPGSYTGLRIGVSTVKGMAMALEEVRCVGVSTLLALAYNLSARDGVVCAVLDARVGQVFAALFEVRRGRVSRLTRDDALTLEELEALLPEGAMAVGDGAALAVERFGVRRGLMLAPAHLRFQRASSVGMAALLGNLPMIPAALLTPEYHRKSQAERERDARRAAQGKDGQP